MPIFWLTNNPKLCSNRGKSFPTFWRHSKYDKVFINLINAFQAVTFLPSGVGSMALGFRRIFRVFFDSSSDFAQTSPLRACSKIQIPRWPFSSPLSKSLSFSEFFSTFSKISVHPQVQKQNTDKASSFRNNLRTSLNRRECLKNR